MQIRVGYELVYECPQPTPMLLMLNVHHCRVADLVAPDLLVTDPPVPVRGYLDGFGNWCSRIVAPQGRIHIGSSARGRDAVDVPISNTFGVSTLVCFTVWTDELADPAPQGAGPAGA